MIIQISTIRMNTPIENVMVVVGNLENPTYTSMGNSIFAIRAYVTLAMK